MNVVIVVPRRADHGPRDRLWDYCRHRWETEFPEWRLIEGHHNEGLFNRSAAINTAVKQAGEFDALLIIDSDVVIDPDQAEAAVVNTHRTNRFTIAYERYCYLDEPATEHLLVTDELSEPAWSMHDSCSSVIAVSRDLWEMVGGFDERFCGWGEEDVGFSLACQAAMGGLSRVAGDVWHLHHPISPERDNDSPAYRANLAHRKRYVAARGQWPRMEAILREPGGPLA